ncbi:LIM domain and actin-binding protein 1 [Operophtera brumata]|uniref:LIM domain and actin-binding protein 1 n=1 Tax=Operophtera brumata TaxID=104452 RepID=A0A0L7LDC0_OPEBR|nr:LIM domain and actin-binding protein 1 [Operophtera brumata]
MSEIMNRFESGSDSAGERHRERKQEIQNIRSRLFMGKQAKIKEMYEQSVLQSEQGVTSSDKISRELDVDAEKARAIKQRFENGGFNDENQPPRNREPFIPKDVVRAEDKVEDVRVQTADISDRFQFFETYRPDTKRKEFRMTPPRQTQRAKSPSPELYHEPGVVRSAEPAPDASLAATRQTASRMINVFRQMEEQRNYPEDTGNYIVISTTSRAWCAVPSPRPTPASPPRARRRRA